MESGRGKRRIKKYSRRNLLHRLMLDRHVQKFKIFVTGAQNGMPTHFRCQVSSRDVAMKSHGSGEFSRHF